MNYIIAMLSNKCPRCRTGNLFVTKSAYARGFMRMHEHCPACKQRSEIEVGFYYGSSYVSYALTVAISVASFIAWWVIVGLSLNDNRIFYWLGFNALLLIVLQPWLMRLSRRVWLSFFVGYNKNWQNEPPADTGRVIESQMEVMEKLP